MFFVELKWISLGSMHLNICFFFLFYRTLEMALDDLVSTVETFKWRAPLSDGRVTRGYANSLNIHFL